MKRRRHLKPWVFGVAAGSLFVLAEAIFGIYPPGAYAFCLSCHVRDLVNTLVNWVLRSHFPVTEIAGRALLLTSPGVLAGALVAARVHGEGKRRAADRPLLYVLLGFLVMTIGIVIFGCPTRIVLRAGYGEPYGIVALLGMFAGIAVATVVMKVYAARKGAGR
jgi:hypothetical protein